MFLFKDVQELKDDDLDFVLSPLLEAPAPNGSDALVDQQTPQLAEALQHLPLTLDRLQDYMTTPVLNPE